MGAGWGALDIWVLDLRMWEIHGIREVSCHWGHIQSCSPSLKSNTHCNLTSCPLGKLNERFTVPTEMDAGHVRPRGCVEEGERAEEGQLQSCCGIRILWLRVQLRDYPWFLFAEVLINLAGFSLRALIMSYTSSVAGARTSLPGFTFPSGCVYLHVYVCISHWWDIQCPCPLTDIVKSYITLLISLLLWPLTLPPESNTAVCPLSS